jgi:hypothetical protein
MDYESGGAKLDLYLVVDDRPDGILGRVQYNPDLFERPTIRQLIHRYRAVLEAVTTNPFSLVSELLPPMPSQ